MSFKDDYPLLDDHFHVFRAVKYDKLMQMFYRFKTGVIYIGGAWCKNCQAIISILNQTAKKNKIRTIKCFDPRFVSVFKEEVDMRDCLDLETKLNYYYLIEKLGFKSDVLVQDTLIPRLPIPAVIGVKNGVCVGIITDEYVLDEKGLHVEGSEEDLSVAYEEKLTELFKKVKAKE